MADSGQGVGSPSLDWAALPVPKGELVGPRRLFGAVERRFYLVPG